MSGHELARHVSLSDNLWAMLHPVAAASSAQTLSLSLYLSFAPSLSLSSSSSSRATMVSRRCAAAAEDGRMVKIELEAAEALADLAFLAARESEAAEKWGSKGKRAMKRLKTESPVSLHRAVVDSAPTDHSGQDQTVVDQQQCDDLHMNLVMKPINGEQETDLLRPCSTSYSSVGGGKSRQNLTEAEKEARRIRRILANRESARQTIRRRQALCEDLAKKAADLSWENENLKKEKELALKEYQSLVTKNRLLKERVAQATMTKVGETQGEGTRPSQGNGPTSQPTDRPSFTPFFWPAIVQSNIAQSQHEAENAPCLQLNGHVSATNHTELSGKQENLISINGSRTPLYLLPCPWFIPLADHGNGFHPQPFFGVMNKQDDNSASNQSSDCASSKNITNVEMSNPIEAKPVNTLSETPVGYLQNGGSCSKRVEPNDMFPESAHKRPKSDIAVGGDATSPPAGRIVSSLSEQSQEQDMYPSKRLMDVIAAAEARRRRKERTKLKNIHGRQCRMQC